MIYASRSVQKTYRENRYFFKKIISWNLAVFDIIQFVSLLLCFKFSTRNLWKDFLALEWYQQTSKFQPENTVPVRSYIEKNFNIQNFYLFLLFGVFLFVYLFSDYKSSCAYEKGKLFTTNRVEEIYQILLGKTFPWGFKCQEMLNVQHRNFWLKFLLSLLATLEVAK